MAKAKWWKVKQSPTRNNVVVHSSNKIVKETTSINGEKDPNRIFTCSNCRHGMGVPNNNPIWRCDCMQSLFVCLFKAIPFMGALIGSRRKFCFLPYFFLDLSDDSTYIFLMSLYTNSRIKMRLPQVLIDNSEGKTINWPILIKFILAQKKLFSQKVEDYCGRTVKLFFWHSVFDHQYLRI